MRTTEVALEQSPSEAYLLFRGRLSLGRRLTARRSTAHVVQNGHDLLLGERLVRHRNPVEFLEDRHRVRVALVHHGLGVLDEADDPGLAATLVDPLKVGPHERSAADRVTCRAECLEDLASLVAQREALAELLRRFAGVAPAASRHPEAGASQG